VPGKWKEAKTRLTQNDGVGGNVGWRLWSGFGGVKGNKKERQVFVFGSLGEGVPYGGLQGSKALNNVTFYYWEELGVKGPTPRRNADTLEVPLGNRGRRTFERCRFQCGFVHLGLTLWGLCRVLGGGFFSRAGKTEVK